MGFPDFVVSNKIHPLKKNVSPEERVIGLYIYIYVLL